jgi:type II secretory pathway pseudopilin PulG
MIRRIANRHDRDAGVTLIEQLMAMLVFVIVGAIVTTSIVALLKNQQRVSAQTGNLNTARKIEETLDYEARYADKVTAPGLGSTGDSYIEWQVENSAAQPDQCTQWRFVPGSPSGIVQKRTWDESFSGSGVTLLTSWTTLAQGVQQNGTTPIFSTAASSTVVGQESVTNTYQGHQEITMTFNAFHPPSQTSNQSITITAINSTVGSPVTSNICAEEGRP